MKRTQALLGKILYTIFFIGVLPIILWLWANYTEHIINYPHIESSSWGIILSILGGALMLFGMFSLMKFGKGLPMNLYPPRRFVKNGAYRLIGHPIYWGFGILLVGVSILMKSASSLWLVTPVTILGMIALVLGYEKIDLEHRFPDAKTRSFLGIYGPNNESVRFRSRFTALLWVFTLLLVGNFVVNYLEGRSLALFDISWNILPELEGTSFFIISLLFVFAAPTLIKKKDCLKKWTISMLIAQSLSIYIALLWPAVGAQYLTDTLLMTVPIFMILISLKAYVQRFRKFALVFYALAIFLILYQLVNSRSSILHLIVALIVFIVASYYSRIWTLLQGLSEKIANSWKEWVFGPIRIINHGFYVGFAAFSGIILTGFLAGKEFAWAILVFGIVVTVFSALWAQIIEGSEKLKRPYGFYGALVGIIFAGVIVWIMGYDVWLIIGVISVGAPWAQGIGRLRCLINGCCHGRPTEFPGIGIRYTHHRSRVCNISELKGELVHPTPLYSILWLFFLGFLLLALWNNHLPYSFIFGLYLIFNGIGRFVEEAFRGEVQTPNWNRLHLYQWTAIGSVIAGILMTIIPVKAVDISTDFGWEIILAAFLGGIFIFFAMGVDFPRSNARFSRLV